MILYIYIYIYMVAWLNALWFWNCNGSHWQEQVVTKAQYANGKRVVITCEVYRHILQMVFVIYFCFAAAWSVRPRILKLWVVWSCWPSKYQRELLAIYIQRERERGPVPRSMVEKPPRTLKG
jgi:hypothetical protein